MKLQELRGIFAPMGTVQAEMAARLMQEAYGGMVVRIPNLATLDREKRQDDVVRLFVQGLDRAVIAERLGLSVKTVKRYITMN